MEREQEEDKDIMPGWLDSIIETTQTWSKIVLWWSCEMTNHWPSTMYRNAHDNSKVSPLKILGPKAGSRYGGHGLKSKVAHDIVQISCFWRWYWATLSCENIHCHPGRRKQVRADAQMVYLQARWCRGNRALSQWLGIREARPSHSYRYLFTSFLHTYLNNTRLCTISCLWQQSAHINSRDRLSTLISRAELSCWLL